MVEFPDIEEGFLDASRKLTADEQEQTKLTILELAVNPKGQGTNLHRLDKARDKNLWSCRVTRDIRIILHQQNGRMTLLYVDHHDKAYAWAENRVYKFEERAKTWKVIKMKEETVVIRTQVKDDSDLKKPFSKFSDYILSNCGVSPGDFEVVRHATEDGVFELGLPVLVLEALMEQLSPVLLPTALYTPVANKMHIIRTDVNPEPIEMRTDEIVSQAMPIPIESVDASPPLVAGTVLRVNSQEQLEAVLSGQWDKWQVFLHPDQKSIVEADYDGPVRVSGSAGTGKTIVALHRANFLLRKNEEARVLLTTLSPALAGHLHSNFKRLINDKPRYAERIEITSLDDYALRLYKINIGEPNFITQPDMVRLIVSSMKQVKECKFNQNLVINEWENVVDAFQVKSAEIYTNIERLGRRTRLAETQRKIMWEIMDKVIHELKATGKITINEMYLKLTLAVHEMKTKPFAHVIVDEAQDLSVAQLKFLVQLGGGVWHTGAGLHGRARTTFPKNTLFFTGDLGQRIFQQPFSWKTFGIDLRGRTKVLKINYRTSQQIRKVADKLLESTITDADGEQLERNHTISAFGGEPPVIKGYANEESEKDAVVAFIKNRLDAGVKPHEMALFVRSQNEFNRAITVADEMGLPHVILDSKLATHVGSLNIASMHTAKGLEFKAVVVMACDDTIVPSTNYLAHITDEGDLKEAYELERHLLYVACTRARDHLMITGVNPLSEFIDDIKS